MSDWDERSQRLLERMRSLHGAAPADAARVRAALGARIAANPGLLVAASAASGASGVARLFAIFGAGSVAGFGAGLYVAQAFSPAPAAPADRTPSVISAPAPSSESAPPAPGDSAAFALPEATPAQPPVVSLPAQAAPIVQRPAPRPSAEAKPRATTVSDLKLELDGLRRAQELLHEGDAAWALARLDELDRSSTSTALIEERMATRAQAECVLGRNTALRAFAEKFPRSAHLERARASCARAETPGVPARENAAQQTEAAGSRHE